MSARISTKTSPSSWGSISVGQAPCTSPSHHSGPRRSLCLSTTSTTASMNAVAASSSCAGVAAAASAVATSVLSEDAVLPPSLLSTAPLPHAPPRGELGGGAMSTLASLATSSLSATSPPSDEGAARGLGCLRTPEGLAMYGSVARTTSRSCEACASRSATSRTRKFRARFASVPKWGNSSADSCRARAPAGPGWLGAQLPARRATMIQ
mmetsp:Transcript_10726/g.44341  ORF Transcript_10726/g.44341 Transcript_10726/m.44341 type:complete len:209 (+) Transcript_10726:498-1124(+)